MVSAERDLTQAPGDARSDARMVQFAAPRALQEL